MLCAVSATLRRTPLYELHKVASVRGSSRSRAGRCRSQYAGVIEEHLAVRSAAGLFDVSHMGELRSRARRRTRSCRACCRNDLDRIGAYQAQYTAASPTSAAASSTT